MLQIEFIPCGLGFVGEERELTTLSGPRGSVDGCTLVMHKKMDEGGDCDSDNSAGGGLVIVSRGWWRYAVTRRHVGLDQGR